MRFLRDKAMIALVILLLGACDEGTEGTEGTAGEDERNTDSGLPEFTLEVADTGSVGQPVNVSVQFDAQADTEALSSRWHLSERPTGSEAQIADPQAMTTEFTPDRPGTYQATFELSAAEQSEQASRIVVVEAATAINMNIEMASLGADRVVAIGESDTVTLLGADDAPIEALPEGLSLGWEFCHRPAGSNVELREAEGTSSGQAVRFSPDTGGRYCIEAAVRRAGIDNGDAVGVATFRSERVAVEDETSLGMVGIALPGAAGTAIGAATFDWSLEPDYDIELISEERLEEGLTRRVLRTEIVLEFAPETTVAVVNRILEEIDGRIVAMLGNTDSVVARIPDPGDLNALLALLEDLENDPAVVAADESVLARKPPIVDEQTDDVAAADFAIQALPNAIDRSDNTQMNRVDHHLAVRGHSAWNMEVALPDRLSNRPWLIVTDFFGDGPPNNDYAAVTRSGDFRNFNPKPNRDDCGWREPCRHGYHVLGIILGDHDAGAGDRGDVTGMYPQSLRVRVYDASGISSMPRIKRKIIRRAKQIRRADGNANIVVNTSIGLTDPKERKVNRQARRYIKAIQRNGLENHLVHAVSAGNVARDGTSWPATRNSGFTYAALGNVTKAFGNSMANLDNILVVENRQRWRENNSANIRPLPRCLSNGSLRSGNVSAIGSNVFSFGRQNSQRSDGQGTSSISGTSMASPQSAGLAALVWAVNPGLSGPQVVNRMLDSARDDYPQNGGNCHAQTAQPVIDALDALRGANRTVAARALMDVADASANPGANGRFDEHDITHLLASRGGSLAFDYAPRDLNGDGLTDLAVGSSNTEPVDLDGDGSRARLTAQLIDHDAVFDESAATDLDLLCYDAFVGNAYQGDAAARNRLLGEDCGIVNVEIIEPSAGASIDEGALVEVTARITLNGGNGGDITLHTGGRTVDTYSGFQPFFDPEITLSTRRVCPSEPTVTVRFEDPQSGLQASDSLGLNVVAASPSTTEARILGSAPKWVTVLEGPNSGIRLDPITLTGRGIEPSCTDPNSEHADPDEQLSWHNQGTRLASGAQITLGEPFFDDGSGQFSDRLVRLEYDSRDDGLKSDTVLIRICSADTTLASRVPGYPECPDSVVLERLVESLANTFGTINPDEIEAEVGRIVHEDPILAAAAERLGIPEGPCDPRFCDPMNPNYIASAEELRERLIEAERDPRVVNALVSDDGIMGALEATSVAQAADRLASVAEWFGSLEEVAEQDRELFDVAYSLALGTLSHFGSAESGYSDGWRAVLDPQALAAFDELDGDRVAPAREATLGFLTAVNETGLRDGYKDNEFALNAGTLGALFGAASALIDVRDRKAGEAL